MYMSQISRKKIENKIEEKISEIFIDSILKLKNKNEVVEFLDELLTPTEKVMLTKRLSIALLLSKGYEYKTIEAILKVTSSTIARQAYFSKHKGKALNRIVFLILEDEKKQDFWKDLDFFVANVLTYHKGLYGIGERQRMESDRLREKNFSL